MEDNNPKTGQPTANKSIRIFLLIAIAILILSYLFYQHFLVIIAIALLVIYLFLQHKNTYPN